MKGLAKDAPPCWPFRLQDALLSGAPKKSYVRSSRLHVGDQKIRIYGISVMCCGTRKSLNKYQVRLGKALPTHTAFSIQFPARVYYWMWFLRKPGKDICAYVFLVRTRWQRILIYIRRFRIKLLALPQGVVIVSNMQFVVTNATTELYIYIYVYLTIYLFRGTPHLSKLFFAVRVHLWVILQVVKRYSWKRFADLRIMCLLYNWEVRADCFSSIQPRTWQTTFW